MARGALNQRFDVAEASAMLRISPIAASAVYRGAECNITPARSRRAAAIRCVDAVYVNTCRHQRSRRRTPRSPSQPSSGWGRTVTQARRPDQR